MKHQLWLLKGSRYASKELLSESHYLEELLESARFFAEAFRSYRGFMWIESGDYREAARFIV